VKIKFHPEAYEEMLSSARFYEEKAGGLGADFLSAVERQFRESNSSRRRAQSNAVPYASGLSWVSLSQSFTKTSMIESSSPLSCISTEDLDIGKIDCAIKRVARICSVGPRLFVVNGDGRSKQVCACSTDVWRNWGNEAGLRSAGRILG
jgi:hypothetical protein